MIHTKRYNISISPELKEIAEKESKKIFGKVNFSGYIQYLINKNRTDDKKIE